MFVTFKGKLMMMHTKLVILFKRIYKNQKRDHELWLVFMSCKILIVSQTNINKNNEL